MRVRLSDQLYWVTVSSPGSWNPNGALLVSVSVALLLAMIAGVFLQRRVNQPLQHLANAVDTFPRSGFEGSLEIDGPHEIAVVSKSFNRMAERLAAQEADRTFMLAGISHDLRTPLAKIRLALALHPPPDDQMRSMIERNLDRVDRMLGQFLDFARGFDTEQLESVSVAETLRSAIESLGIDASVVIEGDDWTAVKVQPTAFERVLANLLRNAVVHGGVPIRVVVTRDSGQISIRVADTGPGAPIELIDRLDQPFVRGDGSRPSDGGVGLGLAIAARFAREHGGDLRLANRKNGGFEVRLVLRA